MDYLDKAREQTVEALAKLDEAIEGAMLAQAPSSGVDEIAIGLRAFRNGLQDTLEILERAEASLQRAKRDSS
ncbi:MAG: hypothetical protein AAFZ91_11155 [Pseudomonadota bacterium]